jgi:hypothetical protein
MLRNNIPDFRSYRDSCLVRNTQRHHQVPNAQVGRGWSFSYLVFGLNPANSELEFKIILVFFR